MRKRIKSKLKVIVRRLFEFGQSLGVNVLPHHFYSSIPDIGYLKHNGSWKMPGSLYGVQGSNVNDHLSFIQHCCSFDTLHQDANNDIYIRACKENAEVGFGRIEAEFLYCFIKGIKPQKVVQIGCGISTAVMIRAAREVNHEINIICIEPYPSQFLKNAHTNGTIRLIKEKAQEVPLDVLTDLLDNDLFFVDSTHTVKTGSEVNRIILEVLPRLKKGVYIHFHDINFPYDYLRGILLETLHFWSESSFLHAFLIHNARYTIKASLSMLHYEKKKELQALFPAYIPQEDEDGMRVKIDPEAHFPSSIYLQVTQEG